MDNLITLKEWASKLKGKYLENALVCIADAEYDLVWWPHLSKIILHDLRETILALEEEMEEETPDG
jgi:hypothetical protein